MAHTEVLAIDPRDPGPAPIAHAAGILRAGGLVAFPTETVYGLGADATSPAAVRRIYEAKERDPSDPLIVHIASAPAIDGVARDVPPAARKLIDAFWPGPLTLVLPRSERIAPAVSAGRDTVAVRMPSHLVARALIDAAGIPVAAPSANRFMRTSATTAAHVLEDLEGRIDLVLDGGPADAGIESTVVAFDGDAVTLLRPGAVPVEDIEAALGRPLRRPRTTDAAAGASPGMLERHYAPRARLIYLPGVPLEALLARANAEAAGGKRVGLILAEGDLPAAERLGFAVERPGPAEDLDTVAANLFAAMRRLDAAGAGIIIARGFARHGAGLAIDDRLRRASTEPATPRSLTIDLAFPEWHARQTHRRIVHASYPLAVRAAREVSALDVRWAVPLLGLRALPFLINGAMDRPDLRAPLIDTLAEGPFVVLADEPAHILLGTAGQFWRLPRGEYIDFDEPSHFDLFDEPGFARAAIAIDVRPLGRQALVTIETRVLCHDEASRRSFERYWRFARHGSALLHRSWLAAIARRASQHRR